MATDSAEDSCWEDHLEEDLASEVASEVASLEVTTEETSCEDVEAGTELTAEEMVFGALELAFQLLTLKPPLPQAASIKAK